MVNWLDSQNLHSTQARQVVIKSESPECLFIKFLLKDMEVDENSAVSNEAPKETRSVGTSNCSIQQIDLSHQITSNSSTQLKRLISINQ